MEYSYRFRLYPNKEQRELMAKNFGCARYVYNYYLAQRQEQYEQTGKSPTRFQQCKHLTSLKQELPWLQEADSTALQAALQDLDKAFQNFFRRVKRGEKPGYPRFKSKHDHRQSYRSIRSVKFWGDSIQLPKLGKVPCRGHREVKGRILSATVSLSPSGKYYASLCCTEVEIEPLPSTGKVVGVSLGVNPFIVASDGIPYSIPEYFAKSEKKLARLQRQLSRKTKGSRRWEKARIKLARLHEHITNQRSDTLHKLSTELIRKYDVICLEDLVTTPTKATRDAGLGEFCRQLTYKAEWYGRKLVTVK